MPCGCLSDEWGYTIIHKDMLVARIRQRGDGWEVLWRSYRDKWESIGDLGGVICDTIEEATEYVLKDLMGIFWRRPVPDAWRARRLVRPRICSGPFC